MLNRGVGNQHGRTLSKTLNSSDTKKSMKAVPVQFEFCVLSLIKT